MAPPGATIDVSNPDDFDYPVGTRFWKEFHVGPEGSQKLGETRPPPPPPPKKKKKKKKKLMLRAEAGWLYTSYVWSENGEAATQVNEGVTRPVRHGTHRSQP